MTLYYSLVSLGPIALILSKLLYNSLATLSACCALSVKVVTMLRFPRLCFGEVYLLTSLVHLGIPPSGGRNGSLHGLDHSAALHPKAENVHIHL